MPFSIFENFSAMAGRARGRGRGLRSANSPLRQPEPETIARIVQESTGRYGHAGSYEPFSMT